MKLQAEAQWRVLLERLMMKQWLWLQLELEPLRLPGRVLKAEQPIRPFPGN